MHPGAAMIGSIMKKMIAVVLSFVLAMGSAFCCAESTAGDSGNSIADENSFGNVGSTVFFGRYDQDGDLSNGPEKIEWIVLDTKDGKSLLLSKYLLDTQLYNEGSDDTTWADCELRAWLNTEFAGKAFNRKETERLVTTHVANDSRQGYEKYKETDGGEDTEDRVFLLSYHEVFDLYLTDETVRQCEPTTSLIAKGAIIPDLQFAYDLGSWSWWLRSPGRDQKTASVVQHDGKYNTEKTNLRGVNVRPAIWVTTDFVPEDPETAENETPDLSDRSERRIRNEKLDAAFESGSLKLAPAEAEPIQYDPSYVDISEGLKAFLSKEGITENDLTDKIGSLQDTDIQVVSVSPAGNSGFLDVQGAGVSFYDGRFHILYPSAERSVEDTYSNLDEYYHKYISKVFARIIGREGVVYSPDGKYAAVFNVRATFQMGRAFAPIIIDLSTGELILTTAYETKPMRDDYGAVTAAAFSGDGRFFYYALRTGRKDAQICFFRYNLATGETEECFASELNIYLLPRMYQIADRSYILMAETSNANVRTGLVNLFREDGEWTIYTHVFSASQAYFRPQKLYYSDNSGYAVLIGSADEKMKGTSAFQLFSPENDFEGFDRYLCINRETDEVVTLSAEEYQSLTDQYCENRQEYPYRFIFNTAMSPDGYYLLANTRGQGLEFELILIRLNDFAIRKVDVPEIKDFLKTQAIQEDSSPAIEWNGDDLIITTREGTGRYQIK